MKQIREWTLKAGFSVLDQGLTSIASFGLNVLLARILPAADYGGFALSFTIFLVISSFHNALLIEPMSVLGPARHSEDLPGYLRRVVWVHFAVMAVLASLSLGLAYFYRSEPVGPSLATMSVACPLILFFWMLRRAHYLEVRPDLAVTASSLHLTALAAITLALWRFKLLSGAAAFIALGGAGAIAGAFSMIRLDVGIARTLAVVSKWTNVAREHWSFGKWLLPSALFFPLLTQVQILLTARFLGLEATGVFRALQNPVLPVIQVVTALATLAIPVLAREFGEGRESSMYRRGLAYTAVMTLVAVSYEAAVLVTGSLWDRLLYGGLYSAYDWLMPILGLLPIATAIATGCSVVLRAIQRPELTTATHIVGGTFGLIASYFLIVNQGLAGAIYGLVISYAITALVSVALTVWARSRITPSGQPASAPVG